MAKRHACKANGCDNTVDRTYRSTAQVCSGLCALALVREKEAKKRSKEAKTNRKDVLDLNRRTLSWQHKHTQKSFNRMRVLEELKWFADRGSPPTCISCNMPLGNDQWCCGHFKTVASAGRLRYDRKNAFLQHNFSCNMNKSGDIEGYKRGLMGGFRFIAKAGALIIDYCERNTHAKKWTCDELEGLRKEFNQKIKQLENSDA